MLTQPSFHERGAGGINFYTDASSTIEMERRKQMAILSHLLWRNLISLMRNSSRKLLLQNKQPPLPSPPLEKGARGIEDTHLAPNYDTNADIK